MATVQDAPKRGVRVSRRKFLLMCGAGLALLTGCKRQPSATATPPSATAPVKSAPTAAVFTSPLGAQPFQSPMTGAETSAREAALVQEAATLDVKGRIVFHSERSGNFDIWSMKADGSDLRQLTTAPELDVEPAWAPDGQQIVFVSGRDDPNKPAIYVMDADGGNQRLLVKVEGALCNGPVWSPDGTRIAFFSSLGGHYGLHLVNADGSNLTSLTPDENNNLRPTWSPDGQRLVFASDRDEGRNLYFLTVADGAITRLTTGPYTDDTPRWSPDGRTILFSSNRAGIVRGLFTVPAAGGEPKLLVTPPQNDESPAWAGNGQFIVFSSSRTQDWELYLMRADGKDLRQLTLSQGMDRFPAWTP